MAVTTAGLLVASLVASAVGTGVAVYNSRQAAKAASAIGEANANLDEAQAVVATDQADFEADAIRDRNKRLAATQRAGFLKSGITLEGTASDVIYDSALEGELEALSVQYKGKISADFNRKQAAISRYEGSTKASAYRAQGTGALLSGIGDGLSITSNPKFPGVK